MKFPHQVQVGPKEWLPVLQKSIGNGRLGYFDPKQGIICIEKDQPEADKYNILLHELIHVADLKNKICGAYKRGLTEPQVTFLAGALFPILAYSGLFTGVTRAMMDEFVKMFEGTNEDLD